MMTTRHAIAAPRRAWVRGVSPSYPRCIRTRRDPIDVVGAAQQHAAYVAALEDAGVEVFHIASDDMLPDSCFVEDTAVVWRGGALMSCMVSDSRRDEGAAVRVALGEAGLVVADLEAPARLDGGDVLHAAGVVFVGVGNRSNAAAVRALSHHLQLARGVVAEAVPVHRGLHLKSAVTLLDRRTALVHDPRAVALSLMKAHGVEVVSVPEPEGANVLPLGDVVLVSAAAPHTAELIRERGYGVRLLDVSEFHKGDGALTCLSLREPEGDDPCG